MLSSKAKYGLKAIVYLAAREGLGARPATRITCGDVLRILDGPLAPVSCVSRTAYRRCDDCMDEAACAVRAGIASRRPAGQA